MPPPTWSEISTQVQAVYENALAAADQVASTNITISGSVYEIFCEIESPEIAVFTMTKKT
jgi:hypothetical protein